MEKMMQEGKDGQKVERNLRCRLTREEIVSRGNEVAVLLGEKYEAELAKKADADKHKETISAIDSRANMLARTVREKSEHRYIECVWQQNDGAKQMELVRSDTGEIVQERPLTADEFQVRLFTEVTENG